MLILTPVELLEVDGVSNFPMGVVDYGLHLPASRAVTINNCL